MTNIKVGAVTRTDGPGNAWPGEVLVRLRFVDALGAESVQPLLPECDRPLVLERPSATPTTPSEDELPFANTMRECDTGNRDRGARE